MYLTASSNIRIVLALILFITSARFVTAQTKPDKNKTQHDPAAEASQIAAELTTLKQYLDKDGGYKTKDGGYYNPKAGTYTDEEGGILDNWKGYTYKDGSYKSGLGDYWDAKTKTFKLADGRVAKSSVTSEEAIAAMRKNVADNDGYDKYLIVRSMIQRINIDHPGTPANTKKQP
jgi:hypothetical protein